MQTLDELFEFVEGWIEPRHDGCGVSADVLDAAALPEPLRRLLEFGGAWMHPQLGSRLFDNRWFRLFLPPYAEIDAETRVGLEYYLGQIEDAPYFAFATDSLDGWEAVTAASSSTVIVTFEGEAYSMPLEYWLVRMCMRSLVHSGPWRELPAYQDSVAGRIGSATLLIEDASPFPPALNPDFIAPEPIYLIDDDVLATPKVGAFGAGGFALAARNDAVLEGLAEQG